MKEGLVVLGLFLSSNLIAYMVYCVKSNNTEKIEIMSVRSELKKIERLNKAEKDSLF
ncbi:MULTISPECIES: hypothetical protein [unclassified Clostridium]|uniref:hypothetical protein n=1 Tax=unclassified Clostridium TaxID=2614128 RepID=UPI0013EE5E3C|nr:MULTISPECIES: hypothetical protein [unclassified Clostridium]MBZ9693396.1 hypothetical protein [Clostridium sp. M14]